MEEFITTNDNYKFCSKKFKRNPHNKHIYDELFSIVILS